MKHASRERIMKALVASQYAVGEGRPNEHLLFKADLLELFFNWCHLVCFIYCAVCGFHMFSLCIHGFSSHSPKHEFQFN